MDGVLHFFLGPDLGVYYDGSVWELLFFFWKHTGCRWHLDQAFGYDTGHWVMDMAHMDKTWYTTDVRTNFDGYLMDGMFEGQGLVGWIWIPKFDIYA